MIRFDDKEILALVEAEVEQHAAYLKWADFEEEAKTLSNLKYELATPQTSTDTKAADALDEASDYISDDCRLDHHWQYCLNEACYSITCSFALRHWLMSQWYNCDFDFDFSLAYKIWNSGYDYEIHGKTCFVFKK